MADYIDRQAAIAALRGFAEECNGSTEAATAAAMAISVISRLPGPLVSVGDGLPDCGVRVLTYSKFKHMSDRKLYRFNDGTIVFRPDGMKPGIDITHWMPMPDEPMMVEMRNAAQSGARYADNPTLAEA